MKKTLMIFIAFLSIQKSFYSQSDFRNGYVIKNDLDTLYGLIDYRGDIGNSSKCHFKLHDSAKTVEYNPSDIFSYRYIDDKYYISKDIKVNNTNERKFLEFLVHGIVDLYCLRDVDGVRYFIQRPGYDMVELKQTEYEFYSKDIKYQKIEKEYIDSLKLLFSDAPDLKNNIENVFLSRKSLINITQDYHNMTCKDYACVVYKKKLPKFKMRVGILGGRNMITLRDKVFYFSGIDVFNGYTFYCNFDGSINPAAGIYFNIPFPYSRDKFSFQYEAIFNENKFSSYAIGLRKGDSVNFSIDYLTFYNNFFIRYDIFKWKFRPIVQLGGTVNRNFNLKYVGVEGYNPFSKSTSLGFTGGLGFAFKFSEKREVFINVLITKNYGILNNFNSDEINLRLGLPIISY